MTDNTPAGDRAPEAPPLSLGKKLAFTAVTLAILLGITGILGEILLRATGHPPIFVAHPVLGSALNTNVEYRFRMLDVDQVIHTNSHGFHDEEYPVLKPPGTRRVFVLGDSFMEALQVADDSTFAKRLQAELNAETGAPRTLVINGGKTRRGMIQQLHALRTVGWQFEPDLVIAQFFMNDVHEDWQMTHGEMSFDEQGNPVKIVSGGEHALISPELKSVLERSYLFAFLRDKWSTLRQAMRKSYVDPMGGVEYGNVAKDGFAIIRDTQHPNVAEGWKVTAEYLRRMNAECRARGVAFALLVVPGENQFDSRPSETNRAWNLSYTTNDSPQRILAEIGRTDSFPVIDMLPVFRASSEGPFHFQEGHWNPTGHRVAAQAAAEVIRREKLLPAR